MLGIRFKIERQTLRIFYPSGQSFLSSVELYEHAEEERQRAEAAEQYAEEEQKRAKAEKQRAEAAEQNVEKERQEKEAALAEIERLRALLAEKSG